MKKITYTVKIYEQPSEYTIDAESKEQAEEIAMHNYNHSDYSNILKVTVTKE